MSAADPFEDTLRAELARAVALKSQAMAALIVLGTVPVVAGVLIKAADNAICERLKVPIGDVIVSRFEDGEVSVRFNENIRGTAPDLFIEDTVDLGRWPSHDP